MFVSCFTAVFCLTFIVVPVYMILEFATIISFTGFIYDVFSIVMIQNLSMRFGLFEVVFMLFYHTGGGYAVMFPRCPGL